MRLKDRGGRRSFSYRDSYYGGDYDRRRNRRRFRSRSLRWVFLVGYIKCWDNEC